MHGGHSEKAHTIPATIVLRVSPSWLHRPSCTCTGLVAPQKFGGAVDKGARYLFHVIPKTHLAHVPFAAWGALTFLIVASTLIGYAVFLALHARVSPTIANTFNYAAPVIALCLSALLLHEPLTLMKLVSGGIALLGVGLMIDHKRVDARQPANVATQA